MWIVGKNINYKNESWEFQGVYDNEQKAVDRCENENWWIGKVKLNEFIPTETSEWKEAYYPKNK